MTEKWREQFGANPHRSLCELSARTRDVVEDPRFVDRVMALVRHRELDWGWFLQRAARRCLVVCGAMVVLAVWWALQSRELVPMAYGLTEDPLEAPW